MQQEDVVVGPNFRQLLAQLEALDRIDGQYQAV
jgi:hypothetical protein